MYACMHVCIYPSIGRAVSNVFDGVKDMGGLVLKGINERPVCGYLTLLEVLKYSTVGRFYKNPQFPVWVIGSSSHYTILFGRDRRIGKMSRSDIHTQTYIQTYTDAHVHTYKHPHQHTNIHTYTHTNI
jgi:hypothetical protein